MYVPKYVPLISLEIFQKETGLLKWILAFVSILILMENEG